MSQTRQAKTVAVLGAGILGSCTALFLARRGIHVDLYDMNEAPMSGVSRWNEGKIHLGYLYGGDPTLASAKQLLPAGLAFAPLITQLIEQPLVPYTTASDDLFLIHRNSIITPEQAEQYYAQVSALVRASAGAGGYLADVCDARVRRLTAQELSAVTVAETALAGFGVPERSIQTQWLADQLAAAVKAQPGIQLRMNTRVLGAAPESSAAGAWRVASEATTGSCCAEPAAKYQFVVNALWHGRIDVDSTASVPPPKEWSNRYRVSLFLRTARAHSLPSAVLAVGPYGDIKNYNGRDFYLSWYPAGLVAESNNSSPDMALCAAHYDEAGIIAGIRAGLAQSFQGIDAIFDDADSIRLAGGYVFAQGSGSLSDPGATLHRRDRAGVARHGHYFSIDTGKYSIAPRLAESVAQEIVQA